MIQDIARRIGRARGYASFRWHHAREQWRRRLQLLRRVGLVWVAVTLVLAAIRLWQRR